MTTSRKWMAPEVVQTSVMDCGPAALKCLLDGFGVPCSFAPLRDACQTSVDGTSIDELEVVAQQLGLQAEQMMLPADFLWIAQTEALPALVVTQLPHGPTHFVIVWRQLGPWVQVMDPGSGRRWLKKTRLQNELLQHRQQVSADAWLEWVSSEATQAIYRQRLRDLGADHERSRAFLQRQLDANCWQAMAQLDAGVRMLTDLQQAGGVKAGAASLRLLDQLLASVKIDSTCLPDRYWTVTLANSHTRDEEFEAETQLILRGAVLIRISGRVSDCVDDEGDSSEVFVAKTCAAETFAAGIQSESISNATLQREIQEIPAQPARELWHLVRASGLLTPLALIAVIGLAMGALTIEALLFRGLFEIARDLNLVSQRSFALLGLLVFVALLWAFELPVISKSLQLGRHLETRLRVRLLEKLPQLPDRFFQSRPVSDMTERGHSLHLLRGLPELVINFLRVGWEVLFTLIGITWIAPASAGWACAIAAVALLFSLAVQPLMSERDLRVRSHFGAMQGFYLDALRGSVPVRIHSAERAVRRGHEALLVQWARAAQRQLQLALWVEGQRSLLCLALAGWLLYSHIQAIGISGNLLLLSYWVLKLPTLGERLASLSLQYPSLRNIALRVLEPINSATDTSVSKEIISKKDVSNYLVSGDPVANAQTIDDKTIHDKTIKSSGVSISLQNAYLKVAGHNILEDVNLNVDVGEHIAIVGPSGAGKSSLLGLLLGWYQLASGELYVDGNIVDANALQQLRRETAWVDPAIQLWNRSLLENLRYSPSALPSAEWIRIIEQADLNHVLAQLRDGLQSNLGEGGARLSGGEGQRVRLARALGQQAPRLVLLDEPFRGLDRVQRALHLLQCRRHWQYSTVLCVTHDIEETENFGRVLVIDGGRLVEDGIPAQLAADPTSRYSQLLASERKLTKDLWGASVWRRLHLEQGQVRQSEMCSAEVCRADVA